MRGGFYYIAQRYNKEKNVYIESHNKDNLSKYILYDDVNNLYGWEMSEYILFGGFNTK